MKVDKMVPEVYYKESRDFSYIGRLFEVVFNYMKTTSDLVDINLDNDKVDSNLIDLMVKTIGFETRHKYITKDLIYIAGSFVEMMRSKGTKDAIKMACQLLITSQELEGDVETTYEPIIDSTNFTCIIRVPEALKDIILLEDLFDYILPSGFTYSIEKIAEDKVKSTIVTVNDTSTHNSYDDYSLGQVATSNDDAVIENIMTSTRSTSYSGVVVTEDTDTETN